MKFFGLLSRHTVGLRVERRHHLQSVCLQDVVLVEQTDENRLGLSLVEMRVGLGFGPEVPGSKPDSTEDPACMGPVHVKSYSSDQTSTPLWYGVEVWRVIPAQFSPRHRPRFKIMRSPKIALVLLKI
ncbi:hypothetical protein AVEN_254439-1 [Araneus ventricosus]|uniref:Uncharacterized protein n=1 Tax=Araneus ventricosus TaxID=182803 RepID=A0A4Y2GM50_ARAVE|nr:hypothetical protein AVEN_254439-1 [Araneus ventricosus]